MKKKKKGRQKLSEKDGSANASWQTVKAVSQSPWCSCTSTAETLRGGIY